MNDSTSLAESGRVIMGASRLGRAKKDDPASDEKFLLGDLLRGVEDTALPQLAEDIGYGLTAGNLKSYRDVAEAWPAERRVAASWTAHRTLKGEANRFDIIHAGMTLRQAQKAIGKNPADSEHPSRWNRDRRVEYVITQLQDDDVNRGVRGVVDERKKARQVRTAAKLVDEDRSAEFREAQRQLREARDAKHPERAAYDAIFKLRDYREYVRAVGRAAAEEESFLPAHRRPDIVVALRDLVVTATEAIAALAPAEAAAVEALTTISMRLDLLQPRTIDTPFKGRIIDAEAAHGEVVRERPAYTVIDGDLA